ncbi:MAG: NAD(P)H-binding protein [Gammaproteobacteria bacterium]
MIAVTAASGRLGHAILQELRADPGSAGVLAVARVPEKVTVPGIEVRPGDYADLLQMATALSGADTVVMISAPVVSGTDRVSLHRNVIAAAKQAGVRRLIFTSVIGGEAEQGTLFAPTQQINRQAEADLAESGLDWVVARNALYIDLDLLHIRKAQETGVYRNNGGDGRCGYLSIDELAYAIARLAAGDAPGRRLYNLVGENLTQAELVGLACEVFGLDVRYQSWSATENIARFMQDPRIAARGEEVAKMLTGCFECIARGAFDVESDYLAAAGRPARSVRAQMEAIRDQPD